MFVVYYKYTTNCWRDFMNKVQFLDLSIDDKINYLNEKLKEGQTVIRIREDIGLGEKALQKIIKESGYKYSQKDKIYYKHTTDILQDNSIPLKADEYRYTTKILQAYKDDLLELINAKDEILNIVKEHREGTYYKDTTNIIEVISEHGIHIKEFKTSIKVTSVRVYDETLDKWKKFCKQNKKYSNQDLLDLLKLK